MTQVRYFGFVKAEEPWTGNQFKMYAGKNGSTFGSKVPAGSVVECGYKSMRPPPDAAIQTAYHPHPALPRRPVRRSG